MPKDIINTSRQPLRTVKVKSYKFHNSEYMIASTPTTNTEMFAFIAVPVFKVLFIKRKDNRNLKSRLLFKKMANFTGKLLQNYK